MAPVRATTYSTNYTDLWSDPADPGWGVSIIHEADTMFAVLATHDDQGDGTWYTATLRFEGLGATGERTWAGDMYRTKAPPRLSSGFQTAWEKAGTMLFISSSTYGAEIVYAIGATVSTRELTRLTIAEDNMSGSYLGAMSHVFAACADPDRNGTRFEDVGPIEIVHRGPGVAMQTRRCTFQGLYRQNGQVGEIIGTFVCPAFGAGNVNFFDLRTEQPGVIGRYTGSSGTCRPDGNIGAMRKP